MYLCLNPASIVFIQSSHHLVNSDQSKTIIAVKHLNTSPRSASSRLFHPEIHNHRSSLSSHLRPMLLNHQSSSSSFPFCIALCLALKASASPPARLGVGVLRPLSVPLPPPLRLIPESLGAAGAAGFLPATGRFAGGAGGVGFARAADPFTPFGLAAGGGGGTCLTTGGGGA
jgi:hypothetical protein